MKYNSGVTLTETMVAVAIIGAIAAIATPAYQFYMAKSQASESLSMMQSERLKLTTLVKSGLCTASGTTENIAGKFGTLTISGTYLAVENEKCPIGCSMTYTLSNNSQKQIAGKRIKVDVLKDLTLNKNTSGTTIDSKYIPDRLESEAIPLAASCNSLSGKVGEITNGTTSTTATEVGDAEVVTGGTPTEPSTPAPTPPTTPTNPTTSEDTSEDTNASGNVEVAQYDMWINWVNLRGIVPKNTPYNVQYTIGQNFQPGSLMIQDLIDTRKGVIVTSDLFTYTEVDSTAKKIEYTITTDKESFSFTLDQKYSYRTGYAFRALATITGDCKTYSNCRNTMINNTGGQYLKVQEPLKAFIQRQVTEAYFVKPPLVFNDSQKRMAKVVVKIYR